ncbi:hypothetical protein [Modicisalibacter luteus]|uniref:MvaT DNA-binding domain-containing protein n=1 Tax=Modicisalibacter luteus TaxID=453962 RepID=A0ABV7M407_9GAMM
MTYRHQLRCNSIILSCFQDCNHKTLKQWKNDFGDETVEGWLVRVEKQLDFSY